MNTSKISIPLTALLALVLATGARIAEPAAYKYYLLSTDLAPAPFSQEAADACIGLGAGYPARAFNGTGEVLLLAGEGTLTTDPRSVTGGGTFEQREPGWGAVIATGTWTALGLRNLTQIRCGGNLIVSQPDACSGKAHMLVHLVFSNGEEFDANMTVVSTFADADWGQPQGNGTNTGKVTVAADEFDFEFTENPEGCVFFASLP